jgi:hypothetical protein
VGCNFPELRKFIIDRFSDDDLGALCSDHYPDVCNEFTGNQTKSFRVQVLLDFVRRIQGTNALLVLIEQERPDVFPEFRARIVVEGADVDDTVERANRGFLLLQELVKLPEVAVAVGGSREVLTDNAGKLRKLDTYKSIHDRFHDIEFNCLRPLETGGTPVTLMRARADFARAVNEIRRRMGEHNIDPDLFGDIGDGLAEAESAFRQPPVPGEPHVERMIELLTQLVSEFPEKLDEGINRTAAELRLTRLVELMQSVRLKLSQPDQALQEFISSIDALGLLAAELALLVSEHGLLQRLDSKLRTICAAKEASPTLGREWERVKRVRAQMAAPMSPLLAAAVGSLDEFAGMVETALAAGDQAAAFSAVKDGFAFEVARVFHDADTNLRDFCGRLGQTSQSLQIVIAMVSPAAAAQG